MKLFAPKYYKDFSCIADRCSHSCCIGWEIDIDEDTLKKYTSLNEGYGKEIIKTVENGETAHFRLCEDERCPHLDEKGLCKIISNLGEEYLCDICREHPRFYNDTKRGKFVGIGMACEEAARIILQSEISSFVEIGEAEGAICEFDAVLLCEEIFDILSLENISYEDKLKKICQKHEVPFDGNCDEVFREIIENLEYLDIKHKDMFLNFSFEIFSLKGNEKILERAFSYFIFRHCFAAEDYEDFVASLSFAIFCERLLASVIKAEKACDFEEIVRIARIVSEEIEYSQENIDAIKFEFMF